MFRSDGNLYVYPLQPVIRIFRTLIMKLTIKFILKLIGGAIYCLLFASTLRVFADGFVPWLMKIGKIVLVSYLINGVFFMGLIGVLCIFLTLPWHYLKLPSLCRGIPVMILLVYGCPALILPWQQEIDYNFINILTAILLDSFIAGMYGCFLFGIFKDRAC